MPIKFKVEELTEAQKTERRIDAMMHSVDLINRLIMEGKHTEQTHDTIERNYRHLEIMLEQDNIKNSGRSLTVFTDAILAGKDYNETPVV